MVRSRRRREVHTATGMGQGEVAKIHVADRLADLVLRALRLRSPKLIRRIHEVDPLECPRCGATTRIVAFVTEPKVIHKILRHLAAKGAYGRSPPASPQRHLTAA